MQSVFDLMQQSVNNGARLAQSFGRNTPSPAFQCAINPTSPIRPAVLRFSQSK
jgi:hypothetical protein